MRPMDLDPTYLPYLEEALGSQPVPIREQDINERRTRMAALRRRSAAPLPPDVEMRERTIAITDRNIPVRVYVPDTSVLCPCVLYYHGGGWMYGSPEQSEGTAVRVCVGAKTVVVSPQYRKAPEHRFPAAFEDCFETLRWVMEHATEIGVDRTRLAVMGESSGGNLAAACALAARDANVGGLRLQVLNYPALGTDFGTESYRDNADAPILDRGDMMYFWRAYLGDLNIKEPHAVPLAATHLEGVAPAFISVAEYDPLREDGRLYARRLADAGVPVELHHARHLPHGFMRAWGMSRDAASIGEAMVVALRRAFASRHDEAGPSSNKTRITLSQT